MCYLLPISVLFNGFNYTAAVNGEKVVTVAVNSEKVVTVAVNTLHAVPCT